MESSTATMRNLSAHSDSQIQQFHPQKSYEYIVEMFHSPVKYKLAKGYTCLTKRKNVTKHMRAKHNNGRQKVGRDRAKNQNSNTTLVKRTMHSEIFNEKVSF